MTGESPLPDPSQSEHGADRALRPHGDGTVLRAALERGTVRPFDRIDAWWAAWIFLCSTLVRLHWNLSVHPIGAFVYSDMKGYDGRARSYVEHPWQLREYDAFYPPGTSWLLAIVKWIFGVENYTAVGVFYALLGSGSVLIAYLIARRLSATRWVAPAVGCSLISYHLFLQQGGYVLSEIPTALFLLLGCLYLLRLLDEGKATDAVLAGATIAVAALIRPQVLLSVAFFGVLVVLGKALWGDKYMSKVSVLRLLQAALPLLLVLSLSAVRMHKLTGRVGLISENGTLNMLFGRCHAKGIYTSPDGTHGPVRFGPPPLIQLERYSVESPDGFFQLDPVFGSDPSPVRGVPGFVVDGVGCASGKCKLKGAEVQYEGYIGDRKLQMKIVRACMERAGWRKQLRFALIHVLQLWIYDDTWPGQASPKPRPSDKEETWGAKVRRSEVVHNIFIAIPALLAMWFFLINARTWPRHASLALHIPAVMLVAAVYFGDTRLRVPYDPILFVLAFEGLALAYLALSPRLPAVRLSARPSADAP